MKNGMKAYAPETAIGTGAQNPVADEVELAEQVPSVDASTAGQGKNKPRANENSDLKLSGDDVAEPTSSAKSTGEDFESRDNPNAKAADADANKVASTVRPAKPQGPSKSSRNAPAV